MREVRAMRINAQQEFLAHIEQKPAMDVLAAALTIFNDDADDSSATFAKLEPGYSADDYEAFLAKIDVEYGSPVRWMLYGRIWYEDGTSSARVQELHGEWWEFQSSGPDVVSTLENAEKHAKILNEKGGSTFQTPSSTPTLNLTVSDIIQKIASGNPGLAVALLQCQSDCEDWAILFQGLLNSTEKSSEIYSIYKDDCGRDSFKLFTRITGLKSMSEPPARSPIDLSWLWRKS
jgi:hypothetical protein